MSGTDWMDTPLRDFFSVLERQADGTYTARYYPYGDGAAQSLMMRLAAEVEDAYFGLLSEEDLERAVETGEVPLTRDGQRTYAALDSFTLRDLPAVLDTLTALEEEYRQREREESERKAAERKERERVRAKERRKLKKLGEW